MKKRIVSLALSSLLMVGALFGFAACEKDSAGNQNGVVKPGTIINDLAVRDSLLNAVDGADITGISFSASANMRATAGEVQERKLVFEGAARLNDTPEADVYAYFTTDEGKKFILCFLRDDTLYTAMGEGGDEDDFTALKASLKGEDPLLLERQQAEMIPGVVTAPASMKLLKNLGTLFEGVVTKTEGGYSLSYDLFGGVDGLLANVETLFMTVESDMGMTLSAFFAQPFVDDTLSKLLNGISAKELYELAKNLPEEMVEYLPEGTTGTAKEYVEGLLRSGAFFDKVTAGNEAWGEYKTFGEVPLNKLLAILSGSEVDLGALKLSDKVHGFRAAFKHEVVSLLLPLFSVEGELSGEDAALGVEFAFDDDKRLIGCSLDAFATGRVVQKDSLQQPDGGKSPEDGNGDAMQPAAADAGTQLYVSLKAAAVCSASPELFDLSGAQYRIDNGTKTIR